MLKVEFRYIDGDTGVYGFDNYDELSRSLLRSFLIDNLSFDEDGIDENLGEITIVIEDKDKVRNWLRGQGD